MAEMIGVVLFLSGFVIGALTAVSKLMVMARACGPHQPPPVEQPAEATAETTPEPMPEPQAEAAAEVPVFAIPITLDSERLIDVGFTQALQEEAARIARWN